MHCSGWICGLENMGIVLGTVRKTSATEVNLTTDRLKKHKKWLKLKIGKALVMTRNHAYGLAIVSCMNTIPRPYLMATDRRYQLDEGDIDLSKLELVDFFPFTGRKTPSVRLSPAKGLREYTSRFEKFVNATQSERKQQLLDTYADHHDAVASNSKDNRARRLNADLSTL